MWKLSETAKQYNQLQAERFWNQQKGQESHNVGGDCINPKCDYEFTEEDMQSIEQYSGWFTCPKCGESYNYLDGVENMKTKAGLSMNDMGAIGEMLVEQMGSVPGMGDVKQVFGLNNYPIDAIVGPYGVEIKTIHSEAQQRFKMGGERIFMPDLGKTVRPKEAKEIYCEKNGLRPAIIGVRLNFYTDQADIFIREGMTDTWIGNKALQHVATLDFSNLNPYKHPNEVPPPDELPEDDETSSDGIPF